MGHVARLAALGALALAPHAAAAQSMDTLGTRAGGMAGAFVAVADDASAVYWNPGGLAGGSFFSLVLDRTEATTDVDRPSAGSRSGFLIALAAPALGLSYYRLRTTTIAPPDLATGGSTLNRNVIGPGDVHLESVVTHHAGATLVQSIVENVAVGATLKMVRGTAVTGLVHGADREALLDDAAELVGRASTRFDADVGLLATAGPVRLGLTVRNLTEPSFATAGANGRLRLERQARAGLALIPADGWLLAADFDLLRSRGLFGPARDAAFGAERRLSRRIFVRGGYRLNTIADAEGRAASASLGGSYAVRGSFLVDAQVTMGSERSARGWGISGRFVY